MRLRQGATLDDPSLPHLPSSARGRPRVSPLGLENGSAPHYPLTVLAKPAFILQPGGGPGSAPPPPCSCGLYGPLTLDYNERARGLTLAVSLWLQPQRNLKRVTKVCVLSLRWHVIQISLIGQKLRPLLSYRSGRKSGGQKKWSYTKLKTGHPKGV